jgi:branched-chain amino acid transport system substrate-binding protein
MTTAAPIRVGILHDMADGPGEGRPPLTDLLTMAIDEVIAAGRLDRGVEFVDAYGLGLPAGTAAAVEQAYVRLVDDGALLVVGPAIGDDALVITPLAERFRMPTVNWAGTERGRSDYMFHLQVGSHEDESVLIARYLRDTGARRVGVVYDRSPIGRRHLHFLQLEADIVGVHIADARPVAVMADEASSQFRDVLSAEVDAVVYLGLGLAAPAVASAAVGQGWSGPRVMNGCGMRGFAPEMAQVIDGWVYVDMFSDANRTLTDLRRRLGPEDRPGAGTAYGYNMGRLVAESLARATELTRDGVRDGLQAIKWLPAAQRHEGTLLGFGYFDRGALHGRYLVLRRWDRGVSVEI